jgi:hypothetical protein
MAFASSMQYNTYRKSWAAVRDAKDDLGRVKAAGGWLRLYYEDLVCRDYIIKEIFCYLKDMVLPKHQEAASQRKIMLCIVSLYEHLDIPDPKDLDKVISRLTKTPTTMDLVAFI